MLGARAVVDQWLLINVDRKRQAMQRHEGFVPFIFERPRWCSFLNIGTKNCKNVRVCLPSANEETPEAVYRRDRQKDNERTDLGKRRKENQENSEIRNSVRAHDTPSADLTKNITATNFCKWQPPFDRWNNRSNRSTCFSIRSSMDSKITNCQPTCCYTLLFLLAKNFVSSMNHSPAETIQ
jgi:hypothetical protein